MSHGGVLWLRFGGRPGFGSHFIRKAMDALNKICLDRAGNACSISALCLPGLKLEHYVARSLETFHMIPFHHFVHKYILGALPLFLPATLRDGHHRALNDLGASVGVQVHTAEKHRIDPFFVQAAMHGHRKPCHVTSW